MSTAHWRCCECVATFDKCAVGLMVVCLCFGVNEREIERVVRDGADSLDAIGLMCDAGTGCGCCRAMLSKTLIEAENKSASSDTDWAVGASAALGVG